MFLDLKLYKHFLEGSLVKGTYTSHKQWVTTVKWSKTDQYHFVSGGYDNQMKLWDSRR